jgi:hypothetical protein
MIPRALVPALLVCLAVAAGQPRAQEDRLRTRAELSGFEAGSTYAEVGRVVAALAENPLVHLESAGRSEEGRDLPLLVIADPPVSTPAEARKRGRPIVLVQAGLHAGEADGVEAAMMLARRLTDGDLKALTRQLVILIAPLANPDGHDREIGRDPSVDGPSGSTASRDNARGLDLDRDYMKLEASETRGLVSLLTAWDPHVVADLHTAAASSGDPGITLVPAQTPNADSRLASFARETLLAGVSTMLQDKHGHRSTLGSDPEPDSGDPSQDSHVDYRPRAAHNYVGLRNRIAIRALVPAGLDFQTRVAVTAACVEELWRASAKHALRVMNLSVQGDRTLSVRTRASKPLDLGLEFGMPPIAVAVGGTTVSAVAPTRERALPSAWIIPRGLAASPRMAAALDRLRWHGIEVETLDAPAQFDVDRFVIEALLGSPRRVDGHYQARLMVAMEKAALTVDAGSVRIKANQRLARLAFYLLEPDSDDGLVTWNIIADGLTVGQGFPVYRIR